MLRSLTPALSQREREQLLTTMPALLIPAASDWMQSDQPASNYAGIFNSFAANDEIASLTYLLAEAAGVLP